MRAGGGGGDGVDGVPPGLGGDELFVERQICGGGRLPVGDGAKNGGVVEFPLGLLPEFANAFAPVFRGQLPNRFAEQRNFHAEKRKLTAEIILLPGGKGGVAEGFEESADG